MPKIRDLEIDEYLYESVTLDAVQIEQEFSRVSADVAYWSTMYARAHRRYLRAKILRDQTKAAAYIEHRDLLMASHGKATVRDIDSSISGDMKVQEVEADVVEAEYEREKLKGTMEAVRAKRDMLITLGAHLRVEMQGNPKINEVARAASLFTEASGEDEDDGWGDEDDED